MLAYTHADAVVEVQWICNALLNMGIHVPCRTLNVPVTDIVRTGDKMVLPQEGMRKAIGSKASLCDSQRQ